MEGRLAAIQQALAELVAPGSGAGWIRLRPGQVLLHEGHVAPGVFVAGSGILRRVDPQGFVHDVPAPCVVPPVGSWESPSATSWTAKTESELLFIPRSRLHEPSEYRNALERLVLSTIAAPDHSAEETR